MNRSNQREMAEKIRGRYEERRPTDMDALRALDARVKTPVNVFSYIFGSISAIIMGCGMSLVMTDLSKTVGIGADPMILGTAIGVVGLVLALINYPLHKRLMRSRKQKYAQEILDLSDRIMGV